MREENEQSGSESSVGSGMEDTMEDTEGIFSDPESEWRDSDQDVRPEAERERKDSYRVMQ